MKFAPEKKLKVMVLKIQAQLNHMNEVIAKMEGTEEKPVKVKKKKKAKK